MEIIVANQTLTDSQIKFDEVADALIINLARLILVDIDGKSPKEASKLVKSVQEAKLVIATHENK